MKVFHTKIIVTTVAKNGSERFGANAVCNVFTDAYGFKSEVNMYGKSSVEAREKMMAFLSGGGEAELVECETLPLKSQ